MAQVPPSAVQPPLRSSKPSSHEETTQIPPTHRETPLSVEQVRPIAPQFSLDHVVSKESKEDAGDHVRVRQKVDALASRLGVRRADGASVALADHETASAVLITQAAACSARVSHDARAHECNHVPLTSWKPLSQLETTH